MLPGSNYSYMAEKNLTQLHFVTALPADSMDHDISRTDGAPVANLQWQRQGVDLLPLEIHDRFALAANQVVVAVTYRLESCLALHCFHLVCQSVFRKGREGAVDRVQRKCRHRTAQTFIQRFRRRVIGRPGKLAVDFKPLMGQAEAPVAACPFKSSNEFSYRLACVQQGAYLS